MTTTQNALNTPWQLAFGRDGTEDYGVISDANGNTIVASYFPGHDYLNTCWLPECDEDEVPALVSQMRLMTAAPKLLDMLKIAVASTNPAKHKWVKEAQDRLGRRPGRSTTRRKPRRQGTCTGPLPACATH
jgi:hypothetical protein